MKPIVIIFSCLLVFVSCKKYSHKLELTNLDPDITVSMPSATSTVPEVNEHVFNFNGGGSATFKLSSYLNTTSYVYANYSISVNGGGDLTFYKVGPLEYKDEVAANKPGEFESEIDIYFYSGSGGAAENYSGEPLYLGFNVVKGGENYAGWIKLGVNANSHDLTLYEYAVSKKPNLPIKAGKS